MNLDGLTIRTYSCLKLAGINTIEDIKKMTLDDLKKVRNLGRRSYNEILAFMWLHGYGEEDGRFVKVNIFEDIVCGPDYCQIGGHDEQT